MANKTAEELFAEGCSHLRYSHHKYDDTKCYEATTENDFMAKDFFEKAAKQDYAPALRELARCYIEGYGVMFKNKTTKGIKYLCQAVLAGDKNALDYCIEREDFFSKLTDSDACDYLKQISDYHDALVAKEEAETEEEETEESDALLDCSTSEEDAADSDELSSRVFMDEMETINTKAQNAAIDLLGKQGDNRYIIVMDWEDSFTEYYTYKAAISISVFGVGLNDDNNLCIAATVDNQGYGCSEECFAQDWVETSELDIPNYAHLYRFVADNIDKAMTKEEADRLAKKYWNGNGHDYGKYDWQDDEFYDGFAKVELDEKTGFVNEDGEEVVPCKYDNAWNFSEGFACVETEDLWGFVNENGEEVIPCKYNDANSFSEGLASVQTEEGWGFINKEGEEIVPCKYDDVNNFNGGLAGVSLNDKWGCVNTKGEEIVPCKYDYIGNRIEDGLLEVQLDDKMGFVDLTGKEVIPCQYKTGTWNRFADGYRPVKNMEGKWGVIDTTGRVVVPFKYDDADNIENGYTRVCHDGKYGLCNMEGKEIIPCEYDRIYDPEEYGIAVEGDGGTGYVNYEGKLIIPCKYYGLGDFKDVGNPEGKLLAFTKTEDKEGGLYDLDGNELQPCIYDQAEDFRDGMARVMIDGKWGYLDATGALSIPLQYEDAEDFEDGTARVKQNGEWITIDKTGKQVAD